MRSPPASRFASTTARARPRHGVSRELVRDAFAGKVTIHHDDGDPDASLDLWPLLEKPTRDHVYCCGPRPMLEAVRDMSGHWPPPRSTSRASSTRAPRRSPTTALHRGARALRATHRGARGRLDPRAMRAPGHEAPSSCESGTCGTCRTRLLAGIADHRDLVLMDDERDTRS
jgi:phthalate 4,5-dioxygenase reductase subunit